MVLAIAAPMAFGIAAVTPRERAAEAALLLAMLGAASSIAALNLTSEGRLEDALKADLASIIFNLFSTAKSLEVI